MRRLLLTTAVVLVAPPAFAQPAPRAEMCGVTFVRAPDEVRYVIEQWLRAEPRCSSSIELRVVPTDGGLYLLAQRPDGRIHERLVPDAQSAGVLVASWVADDWTAPPLPAEPTPAPSAPLTVIVDPLRVGPPGTAGVVASAAPHRSHAGKWISLGMIVQPDNEGGGFRGEVELANVGAWKLGAALSYSEHHLDLMQSASWSFGTLTTTDTQVLAQLGRTARWGRWELRAALGLGAIHTRANVWAQAQGNGGFTSYDDDATFLVGEATGLVTRRLGDSWGLGLGPVISWADESFASDSVNPGIQRKEVLVTVFGSLRYEL